MSHHHHAHHRGTPLPLLVLLTLPIMIGLHSCEQVNKTPVAKGAIFSSCGSAPTPPCVIMPAAKIVKPKGWDI